MGMVLNYLVKPFHFGLLHEEVQAGQKATASRFKFNIEIIAAEWTLYESETQSRGQYQ